jgi:signal transduction histidine kinase
LSIKSLLFAFTFVFIQSLYAHETLSYDISYFEDKNSALSLAQVQTQTFTSTHIGVQNLGITNTPHWFRLKIRPTQEQLFEQWWIKIDYPPLDYLDYYLLDADNRLIKTIQSGELRPFSDREVSDPSFIHRLPFSQADEHTLYIRVQTEGALQLPISILTAKGLIEDQYLPLIIAGMYYGLFFIMALYSSVIFLYTRDKGYLFYLFFVSTFAFWQLSLDGIGVSYIWGGFPWLVEHASILGTSALAFIALLFSRNFLQTKKHLPKMDIFLKYFMYFCLALTFAATFAPYHTIVKVDGILSIITPITLFIIGSLVLRKGYQPARLYVVGWFAFLLGCILFSLNKFNLIGGFYVMNHAQQIGSAIEMLLLSWALGERVKSIQDHYIQKANSLNSTLQERLTIGLLKERQKDKIMLQQSRFAALGEMIEQIAHQWRQPLNTLALINQNLYFKFKLDKFDPQSFDEAHDQIDENLQYMSKTIDDFRNFYNHNREPETYDICEVLRSAVSLSEAMLKYAKITVDLKPLEPSYVHNTKNELLQVCMNVIKNAHDALIEKRHEDRIITIEVTPCENEYCISIEDNAGGIDENIIDKIFDPYFTTKADSHGTGIGLYMSRSITQEHLQGSIHAENTSQGARFIISLPKVDRPAVTPNKADNSL